MRSRTSSRTTFGTSTESILSDSPNACSLAAFISASMKIVFDSYQLSWECGLQGSFSRLNSVYTLFIVWLLCSFKASTSVRKFIEQRFGFLEVGGIEALGEPAIDFGEHRAGFFAV